MKIVFFGNSKYSTIVEASLISHFGLKAVVTLPDQPKGRKKILTPTPVKQLAERDNIQVISANKLDEQIINQIKNLEPDFLVVADYGLILPTSLLQIPKFAPLNVHHSLLPKYRGPAPAPFAILAGEKTSGVTIIKMVKDVDAGDILAQKEYTIAPDETTDSLLIKLNTIGAKLIISVLEEFSIYQTKATSNVAAAKAQDNSQATFTHYMSKQDGFIDLNNPPTAEKFDRMVRAFYPWPSAWSTLRTKNIEQRIKFLPEKKIQMEGKKPVDLETFYRGYPELKEKIEKLYLSS
ncbi:MAG TPA: methionyl-tRNA formyltransferase [Patescibacteria group bacterium]|nr:methionyl-tRNA formyltransferase [Patescibacteria group bacterium]